MPRSVATVLVRAPRLEVRSMEWKLSGVVDLDGEPCAEFAVQAALEGKMPLAEWNTVPSWTTSLMTGTILVQLRGSHLRRLTLDGSLDVIGTMQREDLGLRLEGEGDCRLAMSWDPVL